MVQRAWWAAAVAWWVVSAACVVGVILTRGHLMTSLMTVALFSAGAAVAASTAAMMRAWMVPVTVAFQLGLREGTRQAAQRRDHLSLVDDAEGSG